jgi:single-strand DNA-binding protein
MANLNKVLLIGRLTRDPETRTFSTGGKVAMFGFAVNNRRKNAQSGQWEDEPVFLDVEAFNRGDGTSGGRQLADLVEQYLRKGHQAYVEGHLKLDQWTSKEGEKRSKIKIVLDNLQFLEPRSDAANGEGGSARPAARAPMASRAPAPAARSSYNEPMDDAGPADGPSEGEIPF